MPVSEFSAVSAPSGGRSLFSAVFFCLFFVFLCTFPPFPLFANPAPIRITNKTLQGTLIGRHLEYYVDKTGSLAVGDMNRPDVASHFKRSDRDTLSLGFQKSPIWIRFAVDNPEPTPIEWFLEIGYPLLDFVDLYAPGGDGSYRVIRNGDAYPYHKRKIDSHKFVIKLEAPQGRDLYYLRILSSSSANIPLSIWSSATLFQHFQTQLFLHGSFFGIMIAMFFYNLFILLISRDLNYLYYALYIASVTMVSFVLTGIGFKYLWPETPWMNNGAPLLLGCCDITVFVFSMKYLNTKKYAPKIHKIFLPFIFAFTLAILASFFIPYSTSINITTTLQGAALIFLFYVSAHFVIRRFRAGFFFASAWLIQFFGSALVTFKNLGIVPSYSFIDWFFPFGIVAQCIIFSFGLGDKLNVMKRALEKSIKVKDEFLSRTSHELRTPLNVIVNLPQLTMQNFLETSIASCSSCGELFELEEDDKISPQTTCPSCHVTGSITATSMTSYNGNFDELYKFQAALQQAGKSLSYLIDNILDSSDIENSNQLFNPYDVDFSTIVESVTSSSISMAEKKQIKINTTSIPSELRICADDLMLHRIVHNLIDNAIKFSHPGGEVAVALTADNQNATLSVQDNGIGISQKNLDLIFKEFRQVEEHSRRKYGGLGLGLAITRRLVHLHNGTISVESELNKGSTFKVSLPRTAR